MSSLRAAGGCMLCLAGISFFITLILSINSLHYLGSDCPGFRFLGITLFIIGFCMMFILYCANVPDDSSDHNLPISLCLSSFMLLLLLALGIFALAVSSEGGGKSILGISYKQYYVESYSKWMQNKVHDAHNWEKCYKKVIVNKEHICNKFDKKYKQDSLDKFHKRNLFPYESGCCKPPEECNFKYTSPTVWVKPESGNYSNVDCNNWNNDPKTLCYDCQSCKAALLQDVTSHWFFTGVFLVVIILGLLVLLGIVCFVIGIRSDRSSENYSRI
ncbi:tetraspanin-7-like [Chenopodium quinoa]|uniref:tetraspanin-7-like n=1 Tax=Chenopodium quinoa TaxID=63459 RepID=UPI000B79068D|nr:tetraspanin-7-like [Chenopodium quinoa]